MGRFLTKSRVLKILMSLVLLIVLALVALYYTLQSPRFLKYVIHRVNQSISGEISYEVLEFNFERRYLKIRGLVFKNQYEQPILALKSLDLNFDRFSAVRARLDVTRLRAEGLVIDQAKEVKKDTTSTWRTTLRLILKRVSITDALLEDIDVYLRNGDSFHFDQATVGLTRQIFTKQKVDVWVSQSLLKPGNLEIKSSTLRFTGEVTIPVWEDFDFLVSGADGKLTLQEIEVGKLPATSFSSDFKIGGNTIYLENGRLQHADGSILVDIDYTPKDKAYVLDLKTAHPFPLSSSPKMSKEMLETFQAFELELHASLKGYRLVEMDGNVNVLLKVHGNTANKATPRHDLTLQGQMQNGVLNLKKFHIQSAKTTVDATGSVDFPRKRLDVKVSTKKFDLATLIESLTDLDLIGYVDAEGTIQGDFKGPTFRFNGHGHETGYSFLRFGEVTGLFKIENGVMSYEGGAPPGKGHSNNVQVRTDNIFRKDKRTVLKTQFQNMDVSALLDNPDIHGKVSGTFDLEDTSTTNPTGILKAEIDDFLMHDFHLGEIKAEGKLGNRKFVIAPLSFQPPGYDVVRVPKEAVFSFDDRGVKVDGEVLPGATLKGNFTYNTNTFFLESNFTNLDLRPILASLSQTPLESYADGQVKMAIGLNETVSKIDIKLSRLSFPLEEGEIREAEPIDVSIVGGRMTFNRFKLKSGQGVLSIQGNYVMDGNSNLSLTGKMDLGMVKLFPGVFREGSGFADVDLRLSGNLDNPRVTGDITFQDGSLTIRALRGAIDSLKGKLSFTGDAVKFDNLRGTLAEGDVILNGSIAMKQFEPQYYDVKMEAREASISEPGVYKIVFSGDFSLKGPAQAPVLAGGMFISEGRYTRNFNITELVLKPERRALPAEPNPFLNRLQLDLSIRSPGELAIKNNVAKMFLRTDLYLKGPATKPQISGALEVLEGEFHYFKIDFENARGTVDFRGNRPYVDVIATKEFVERFNTINVSVHIQGFTDNLQLSFSSDTGLEKRDILALVFTGALPGGSGFTSTQLAGSVLASQLTSILQSTVGRTAQLDIIRLEAGDPSRSRSNFSTLVLGKQVTERLSLEFKTDLGIEDPTQGVQMEYLLLDNVLLKASQLTDATFDFNFTLRWKTF